MGRSGRYPRKTALTDMTEQVREERGEGASPRLLMKAWNRSVFALSGADTLHGMKVTI